MKKLLDRAPHLVNVRDLKGRQALSYAAAQGHTKVVHLLLRKGASIRAKDTEGRNALSWAVSHRKGTQRNEDGRCLLENLIAREPEAATASDVNGWNAIFWTIDPPGHLEALKILIRSGHVDINAQDRGHRTPLSWCAAHDLQAMMLLLLRQPECQLDVSDNDGCTPLLRAAAMGMVETCSILLDHGADQAVVDHQSRSMDDWLFLSRRMPFMELRSTQD